MDQKSNEVSKANAIPKLLGMLMIEGASIAKKADYVLALKGNQTSVAGAASRPWP